jgi:hypothetical protein
MQKYIKNVVNSRKLKDSQDKNYDRIIRKYPDKVLLYVHLTNIESQLPKEKFLVPKDITFGDFCVNIKKYININSKESLTYFVGDEDSIIPRMNENINYLYQKHKNPNGILYVTIIKENTFGN